MSERMDWTGVSIVQSSVNDALVAVSTHKDDDGREECGLANSKWAIGCMIVCSLSTRRQSDAVNREACPRGYALGRRDGVLVIVALSSFHSCGPSGG